MLAEHLKSSVDICLDKLYGLFIHLLALSVDKLDSIVIVRIVACRYHYSTVKVVRSCHISNRRCCCDMEQVRIRAWGNKTAYQWILKHIARTSCILSDYYPSRSIIPIPLLEFTIIPSKESSHLECMVCCKIYICFTTKTIRTKIFSHNNLHSAFNIVLSHRDIVQYNPRLTFTSADLIYICR